MTQRAPLGMDALCKRLASVELLSLDVDGILTDGGLFFDNDGNVLRRFNVKDGLGMQRVMRAGVAVAMISAGRTESIRHRASGLGIPHCYTGVSNKLDTLKALVSELGISMAEVLHMGDDLNDIEVMNSVGLSITVADAVPEAKEAADFVTEQIGGHGAVRWVADRIVQAKGGLDLAGSGAAPDAK